MTALAEHGGSPESAPAASSNESHEAGAFVLPTDGVDLREVERTLIEQALRRSQGNQTKAARLLRISRYALRSRMKKFDLLPWPTDVR